MAIPGKKFAQKFFGDIATDVKNAAPSVLKYFEKQGDLGIKVGKTVSSIAGTTGRGLNTLGSSKGAILGIAAVSGTAGLLSETAPAAKDAMLEASFGDPNADVYFTGRDLSSRSLVGSMMGGVGGGLLQASAPGDFIATNPAAGMAAVGAGGLAGGIVGGAVGSTISRGVRGAIVGGVVGTAAAMSSRINNNQQFYRQSPYFTSSQTAADLNATGDIVLGMHNSRRGY